MAEAVVAEAGKNLGAPVAAAAELVRTKMDEVDARFDKDRDAVEDTNVDADVEVGGGVDADIVDPRPAEEEDRRAVAVVPERAVAAAAAVVDTCMGYDAAVVAVVGVFASH